jgi:ATP-dependent exoDNAse (exonuclease V) beta subunit
MATLTLLEERNSHPRDKDITFDEGPHIYTIKGDSSFTSVTTWVHHHFEEFDADKIIKNMMRSKNWPKSKYYNKTPDEIKAEWDQNRDEAAAAGTKMHYDIECFYNECYPNTNNSEEFGYFMNFEKAIGSKMTPYRTEWMVYHEEYRLAGSIDMIFENPDGTLQIYDWKRCKEIKKTTPWQKYAKTPALDHLPDTNFWHYSLQLNTYKKIIEEKYGKKVTNMYLVCLHPNNTNKNFIRLEVPNLQDDLAEAFNNDSDRE